MSHIHTNRRSAFTLVELLVVVGIISVLIGLILPSLNRARDSANTVKCLSNLRQIGIVNQMYTIDYKGQFFPTNWPSYSPITSGEGIDKILQYYLQTSDVSKTLWTCPSADHGQSTNQFPLQYAFNQGVHPIPSYNALGVLVIWNKGSSSGTTPQYTLKNVSQLRRTTDIVHVADASLSSGAWTTTGQLTYTDSQYSEMYDPTKGSSPIDQLGGWSWTPNSDIGGSNYHMRYRHGGNKLGNVLFLDGHAASYLYNDPAHPNVGLRNLNFATGY